MTFTSIRLACLSCLCIATAAPCLADSVASSASSAGSASSGEPLRLDTTVSSDSSRSDDKQVSEGDYRIVEVAAVADRPGMLRLKMQPTRAAGRGSAKFTLDLPPADVRPSRALRPAPSSARGIAPTGSSSRAPRRTSPSSWCSPTTGSASSHRTPSTL